MIHDVVEITQEFVDSPDVVLLIECSCGEVYRFTKEFDPKWNLWTKNYYIGAMEEAYSVRCPKEDPMEKRAVVLTEQEKEAHAKAASKAQQRRIEQNAKRRKEEQKKKEDTNAKR
tara:strand:- start:454 stop:798 length:345 start_codon:yes stop_codon:yes gene_type:complete